MAPKNERFEMRVDETLLGDVDRWRAQQDDVPSRAEAMRRLVELGLARGAGDAVKFSDGEKLITFMLRDIYRKMNLKDGEIDPDFMTDVIVGGHYWAPKWELQGLFHNYEDKPQDVSLVVDVLDMWDFIESAYESLSKKDKALIEKEADPFGKYVSFSGFDGNNEAECLGIARFFVEKLKRFTRFGGRDLNSHMPTIMGYRRMLSVFAAMRSGLVGHGLSATQIIALLNARRP
ncbi:MAG: YfbU family protein [Bacteroidota bacterium]